MLILNNMMAHLIFQAACGVCMLQG